MSTQFRTGMKQNCQQAQIQQSFLGIITYTGQGARVAHPATLRVRRGTALQRPKLWQREAR